MCVFSLGPTGQKGSHHFAIIFKYDFQVPSLSLSIGTSLSLTLLFIKEIIIIGLSKTIKSISPPNFLSLPSLSSSFFPLKFSRVFLLPCTHSITAPLSLSLFLLIISHLFSSSPSLLHFTFSFTLFCFASKTFLINNTSFINFLMA